MKIYKPYPGKGVQYGILFLIIILVIMGIATFEIYKTTNNFITVLPMIVLKIILVGMFGYFIYTAKTLAYLLDDNKLIIKWGFSQKIIDLNSIGNVEKKLGITAFKMAGVGWPGLHIGAYTLGNNNINLYATRLAGDVIIFKNKWESIGITPENPDEFLRDLSKLIPHLDTKIIDPKVEEAAKEEAISKNEKVFKLLTRVNILSLLITFVWVKLKIPTLPAKIPMHIGVNGIDRYGSPKELFIMPAIGLAFFIIMFFLSSYYRGNKTSICMLLGSSILFIILMNLALISILSL